jgi:hypothetical protein
LKIKETLYPTLRMCTVKPVSLSRDSMSTKWKYDVDTKLMKQNRNGSDKSLKINTQESICGFQ